MSKVFGHAANAAEAPPAAAAPGAAAPAAAAVPAAPIDVVAVLTDMASKSGQTLNWRTSIVDLMKLLGLDSSLASRTELAGELGYTGNTSDSAAMNIWLHKQVMTKFAENGGKVPDDLKA
jgi:3-oxoacyl-ACP reductase-like protein